MKKHGASSIISFLTGLIIFILAVIFPLVYFFISYEYMKGSIETEGKISSAQIMKIIASNPSAWEFEQERLQVSLSNFPRKRYSEKWRTINSKNEVIAESNTELYPPFIMRAFNLMDSGTVVGRLEIYRSLRPLLLETGIIVLLMLPIGIGSFLIIRFIPIKMIRRTEEALRESKELLEKIFSSLREAVFIIDPVNLRIIDCNTESEKMFGFARKEILGQPHGFLSVNEREIEDFNSRIEDAIKTKGFFYLNEILMKRRDGSGFPAEYTVLPLLDESGSRFGLISVTNDITERKKLEEDMLRSQKLESLGILAGGIAHDFNNFLTSIVGCVSALKLFTKQSDETYQMLEHAEKASMRAKDLTQQLLTFSKGGEPIKKVICIADILRYSAAFALRGSRNKCDISIPSETWQVLADEGQISQVINNIVINADQSMPEGGTIKISCDNVVTGNNEVPGIIPGEYIMVKITDQGKGIPEEFLKKIFDPYFTTKTHGNGLGLATSYSIIKKHKGQITVESKPGEGSSFSIYLPASRQPCSVEKTEDIKPLNGKGRILVMDDEESVRKIAGWMLDKIGYEAEYTENGAETIEKYRTEIANGRRYDAVIIDLTIPGGMGGEETIKRLLEIDPDIKAIASSGYSNNLIMSDFASYGFKAIIVKPYNISELSETISTVVKMPDTVPAARLSATK